MGWSDAYDPTTLRLTSKASPEAGTVSYTYNTDGTVATVTDAKSQQKKFTYDSSGRVTKISPSGQNISYPYGSTLDGTNTLGRVNSISYSAGSHSVQEGYTYTSNGDVAEKGIGLDGNNPLNQGALIVTYSYNNDGTLYSVAYPEANTSILGSPAATYTYGRDSMYRLNTLTDQNNNTLVSGVTYSPANQILSLATSTFTETSTYNANLQLATLVSGSYSYQYNYVTGQNNGRVSSIKDNGSGETITYQYDSLNRLIQASGVNDPHGAWSQEFTFDGFGNLTQKIGNNAPNNLTINVNPATNQLTGNGAVYDANGNLTQYTNTLSNMTFSYDSLNRLATASGFNGGGGTATYGYDGSNQRVYSKITNGGVTTETFFFYGADGKKLGVWTIPSLSSKFTLVSLNTWFGGRLLKPQDRLNSIGKYFPYGEDRTNPSPANPPNGQEKFATYTRDAETGLDYAYQRYYSSGLGRFMTPDPLAASAIATSPQTQNRYPYANDDPVNHADRNGADATCGPDGAWNGEGCYDSGAGYGACVEGFVADNNCNPAPPPSFCSPDQTGFLSVSDCTGDISAPPVPPKASPPEECSLSLWSRPAGIAHDPGSHTYILFRDSTFSVPFIFEGGPDHDPGLYNGTLEAFVSPPSNPLGFGTGHVSNPGRAHNIELGYPVSAPCDDFEKLITIVDDYDKGLRVPYAALPNGVTTWNSNSFTFTLLGDLGLSSSSFGAAPTPPTRPQIGRFYPGWRYTVPGLH